jgi:uncharacterized membrane protein
MQKNYLPLSARTRLVMLTSFAATLLLFTVNTLITPSCARESNTVIWLLHALPLLAFLPAMLKGWVRALAWLCFVLLFFFLKSVDVAFMCSSVVTVLEVFAVSILFIATMLYIRWQSRALKQLAAEADNGPSEKIEPTAAEPPQQ